MKCKNCEDDIPEDHLLCEDCLMKMHIDAHKDKKCEPDCMICDTERDRAEDLRDAVKDSPANIGRRDYNE